MDAFTYDWMMRVELILDRIAIALESLDEKKPAPVDTFELATNRLVAYCKEKANEYTNE